LPRYTIILILFKPLTLKLRESMCRSIRRIHINRSSTWGRWTICLFFQTFFLFLKQLLLSLLCFLGWYFYFGKMSNTWRGGLIVASQSIELRIVKSWGTKWVGRWALRKIIKLFLIHRKIRMMFLTAALC